MHSPSFSSSSAVAWAQDPEASINSSSLTSLQANNPIGHVVCLDLLPAEEETMSRPTTQVDQVKNEDSEESSAAAEQVKKSNIIVVSRGANEDDPPLWTIVNNSTPMNSAVNVITGTRITHGHPLMIG